MRTLMLMVTGVAVAGCGQGDSGAPTGAPTGTTPEAAQVARATESPARNAAETAAVLAALPAPYDQADLDNGRRVFARCRSCHTLPEGGSNMTGPNLYGVFGRQAASQPGYRYSNALKQAGFAWDGERLDQWLENPRTYLVGTRMSFAGIPDATDRRDVIAYLKVETGYTPPARP